MDNFLPENRLSTTDESGKRVYLYPADYRGKFRARRNWVHGFLILLFLLVPWIHVNGRQLVQLNVAAREFFFFGLHFRAHDAPLMLFFVLGFVFLLGLVTALWGRIWCGWACPQTVFTDLVFRRIERWIEGAPRARRELDEAPLSPEKLLRKGAKWALFALLSLAITHSFLAYFVGSRPLIQMITGNPAENWGSFLVILGTTAVILFDFGWFREQFCVIVCPYGRFQSVMLDDESTVVAYDVIRGEPRRGTTGPLPLPQGDCVSCNRCVQVCPTGIDIRRGLQMECIACTACIDACDEVMTKIHKPLGLIRYSSAAAMAGRERRSFSPRVISFAALFVVVALGFAFTLANKEFLDLNIFRAGGEPYELLENGRLVSNHFRLELSNQTGAPEQVMILLGADRAGAELIAPINPVALGENESRRVDFFIRFPAASLSGGARKIEILLRTVAEEKKMEVTLVGPGA